MADGTTASPASSMASPFAPLRLSDEEKQTILNKIDELLSESLTEYEQFLLQDRATVSEHQWKPVVKRDGLSAYRKRRVSPRASDSSKVHTIFVVGEIVGTVEDAMLGSVHASSALTVAYEQFMYKSSSLGSALLSSIIEPTPTSPDRMVRITWDALGSTSSTVNSMVKPRDFVTAVATGTTISSTGERIGYRFFHSVDIPGAPAMPGAIRTSRHFTLLHRQVSHDRIHVYIMGRVDPKGRIPTGVAVRGTADAVIETVARVNRFAAIKKRTFLLYQQLRFQSGEAGNNFPFGIPAEFTATASGGVCTVCGKQSSGLLSAGKSCAVCGKSACASCVKSQQVIVAADKEHTRVAIKKLPFCSICEQRALQLSGWEVGVAEAAAGQSPLLKDASPSISSTASC